MSAQRDIAMHVRRLAEALRGSALRWATAESCTGGQLAALMARDVDLGSHLERGFVVCSIDAKCEQLGVDRSDAERCDAVNRERASGHGRWRAREQSRRFRHFADRLLRPAGGRGRSWAGLSRLPRA